MGEQPAPAETPAVDAKTPAELTDAQLRRALTAEDPLVRQDAGDACVDLATESPDAMAEYVDVVAVALADDSVVVAQKAAAALVAIAEARPDAVADVAGALVGLYDRDVSTAKAYGAKLLGTVAVEHAESVAPHVEPLVAALAADDTGTQGVADSLPADAEVHGQLRQQDKTERKRAQAARETVANVIVAVAEADPDAVAPIVDDVLDAAEGASPLVLGALLDAVGAVAAADPETVSAHVPRLAAHLDADHAFVRGRAITALGHADDASVVPQLRSLAADDPDADVRALAAETADWLADA